jgi:DNA-binding transcriptional MerR regulator
MFPIGEVARRTGLRDSALRYYERIGLLTRAQRRGGKRWYDEAALDRLAVIHFARECGFTLREIRTLFAGRRYSARMRRLAGAKVVELDAQIVRARAMQRLLAEALRCDCLDVSECGRRIRAARSR